MAAPSTQGLPAEKLGLIVDTITTSPHRPVQQRPSQDTLGSQSQQLQPFPALLDEKSPRDHRLPRPSDVSTPATARPNPFDTDVEAMITNTHSSQRRSNEADAVECTKGGTDCHAWPGQEHWRRKAKAAKKSRHNCTCLAGMSKRNRVLVRILIIALIVGIAVGVGFGVSKPLGTGIWKSEGQNGS